MAKLIDLNGLAYFYGKIKAMLAEKLGKNDVATVATSGSYNDLTDKPTIPASITIDSELSTTSTNPVQNKVIKAALDGKLGKNAAAASANKLNTNGGSATQPIYFANGVPVATTYTLGKSVPSDAKFTDTVYNHPTTHPASMITGLASVATSGSYSDLSNKPTIPVVPTNVSAFINDAGYLTQHQSLDDYAKKTDVNTALANKLGINDTAAAAIKDDAGNTISTTYASKADVSALLSTKLGVTATAYAATRDGAGNNIVNTYAKKTDIPSAYTLPNATSSTLGGVKIGSNISVSDGTISITKSNVTSALGYTPPASDTTYGDATTTSSGLMSSTDKVKLNGIADNANYYIHPPTHPASMISGLATVATSGSYNDLTNKPGNATTSAAGLMSAADKAKLDKVDADAGSVKLIIYS